MAIRTPSTNNKEEPSTTTREIPVEQPQMKDETVPVDFQDEDMAQQFAGASTKPTDDGPPKYDPNTPADEVAKDVNAHEATQITKLKYQDLQKFAEWIMNLIDTSVASGLKWLARDSSITAYQMPKQSKEMLTEQLAIMLSRHQSKMRVEFVFLIGLMMVYSIPVYSAIQSRKNNNRQVRRDDRIKKKLSDAVEDIKHEEQTNETHIVKDAPIPVKRRGGRPRKIAS